MVENKYNQRVNCTAYKENELNAQRELNVSDSQPGGNAKDR